MITNSEHWSGLSRRWDKISSPLRPVQQDIDIMSQMLGGVRKQALLLGVTPELTALSEFVTSIDKNEDMIKSLWERDDGRPIHGNWLDMSSIFEVGEFSTVIGDGSLNCIRYPDEINKVFSELDKVTTAGSDFVLRVFMAPDEYETFDEVIAEAKLGHIMNFHSFRWRMAHAIAAETSNPYVEMRDVCERFNKIIIDREDFAKKSGYDLECFEHLDAYANSEFALSFPTMKQFMDCIPKNWEMVEYENGNYDLGERCPIIHLRRKKNDIIWPNVEGQNYNNLGKTLNVLLDTQKLSSSEIEKMQFKQLKALTAYYHYNSEYFREILENAGISANGIENIEQFKKLPLLSRSKLQADFSSMDCSAYSQGASEEMVTSGSTGIPVKMKRGLIGQVFWFAYTMRDHIIHERDFMGTLAILRGRYDENRIVLPDWGAPVNLFAPSGRAYLASLRNMKLSEQVEWINKANPDYLLTLPTCLEQYLIEFEKGNLKMPKIKEVRTISEALSPELRKRTKEVLGVNVVDLYSSQEAGVIANECPYCGQYHVNESYIIEVLDKDGNDCKPGEKGRIVITDLHNYDTPLIRYDIGDYAERGDDNICKHGIGLRSLKRIYGRERNMMKFRNGDMAWPFFGYVEFMKVAPIRQYQFIQKSLYDMEVRFVCNPRPSEDQEKQIAAIINSSLGQDFNYNFVYFDEEIPRSQSCKLEEFICEV